jgi:hypothetical protein
MGLREERKIEHKNGVVQPCATGKACPEKTVRMAWSMSRFCLRAVIQIMAERQQVEAT